MTPRFALCALLCSLAACDSGDSPVDRQLSAPRIERQVGPAGALLRGPGGTALEGFTLEIPPGALDRLVAIVVEPGDEIAFAGSDPASQAFALRVDPDPGVLRLPATFRVGLEPSTARRNEDLFVAARRVDALPSAIDGVERSIGIAAEFGDYDTDTRSFSANIRVLHDLQLRQARARRLPEDALRLTELGYGRLAELTSAALIDADALLAEAQHADPYSGLANLFRAFSRILVAVDDRSDTSAELDSVGEVLQRSGFDVGARSLIDRVRTGLWPSRLLVPADAPTAAEIVRAFRAHLRPAIESALLDLDRVPATIQFVVALPGALPTLPGDREIDVGDVLALRTLLDAAAFLIDHTDDYDLAVDPTAIAPRIGSRASIHDLLVQFPGFGRLLTAPDAPTVESLRATLADFAAAFAAIDEEDDSQLDDLVVFPGSLSAERGEQWRANIEAIRRSLDDDTEERIVFEDGSGSLFVRFGGPFRNGVVTPRAFVPELFRFVPIAGSLPDPTLGGLFPRMTQDAASDLLNFANVHAVPTLSILADGAFGDWTAAAEALVPADPIGDTGDTGLGEVDLWRVWLAVDVETVAFRISLADGVIGYRPDRATVYGFVVRPVGETGYGEELLIEVFMGALGPEVRVRLGGITRTVASAVGIRGSDFELTLDRFQLLDPDEPLRDREFHAFAQTLEIGTGVEASDRSRPVLVRF